nr:MAG TPA: hypothetical protein [Caudoviricetes sp.]
MLSYSTNLAVFTTMESSRLFLLIKLLWSSLRVIILNTITFSFYL